MHFACSFTRQRCFGDWERIFLKTGFKVQVFENATVIVREQTYTTMVEYMVVLLLLKSLLKILQQSVDLLHQYIIYHII